MFAVGRCERARYERREGMLIPKKLLIYVYVSTTCYEVYDDEYLNILYLSFMQKEVQRWPCLWNGVQRPCYLFARKFYPEALNNLLNLFSNYSSISA